MQAKRGLYGIKQSIDQEAVEIEKQIFNATIQSKDYTKQSDFMSVAEFKNINMAEAKSFS